MPPKGHKRKSLSETNSIFLFHLMVNRVPSDRSSLKFSGDNEKRKGKNLLEGKGESYPGANSLIYSILNCQKMARLLKLLIEHRDSQRERFLAVDGRRWQAYIIPVIIRLETFVALSGPSPPEGYSIS